MSKIALVDDDRNILTSVSMTLEAEGFEVETYNDGQQALDAFNKKLPDMAVLDINAPYGWHGSVAAFAAENGDAGDFPDVQR
jgi:DNA-binding response OmpR family regulator